MKQFVRNSDVEAAPMLDETVLYNPVQNKFCVLNETSARIWEHLAKPTNLEQLQAAICEEFDGADEEVVARDIQALLEQFESLDLVKES